MQNKMAEANKTAATGLEVRLVNLEADAGAGLGVFECLHDKSSAADLADHLRKATGQHYGLPIRRFLEALAPARTGNGSALREIIETRRAEFTAKYVPADADGQVLSVAGRFALVAVAGELATHFGVLPWAEDEATRAAAICFENWLATRGHSGAGEDEAALAHLRSFITAYGQTRFAFEGSDDARGDRVGWRKLVETRTDYLFQYDRWRTEVFRGTSIDAKRALAALDRLDLLHKNEEPRLTAKASIGGHKPRVVWVKGTVLDE